MLVLFLNRINDKWLTKIEELKNRYENVRFEGYFSNSSPRSLIKDADVIVTARLSKEEIESSNLKLIIVPMAGV
ncbi:MAG: hydroxyacid dehydrogenase, partial [Pseudothermotoga sp.]